MSYFKDIYGYLTDKYPDRKVYVISDEHFGHERIIDYTRGNFSSVEEMNNYIIKMHNEVVGKDDVVIFLGDFCLKGSSVIKEMLAKLNGHKLLILGNHDSEKLLKSYKLLGFDDVFMYPVSFKENYLSHYAFMGEIPDDPLYTLMKKEFLKTQGINFHGHEHDIKKDYLNSKNVACESTGYKPLYIGSTGKEHISLDYPLFINSPYFEKFLGVFQDKSFKIDTLLSDYIYTMMLEALEGYRDDICFFGSFMMHKKYGYQDDFTDLDASVIYNLRKSKKENRRLLIKANEAVFTALKDIDGFNISFYKRIDYICILSSLYARGDGNVIKSYLDMNVIMGDVYRPKDFTINEGMSDLEKLCLKYNYDVVSECYFPKYSVVTLKSAGDIANLILQYLFQANSNNKAKIIKKIKFIMLRLTSQDRESLDDLEEIIIRYLIRNILFLSKARRMDEIAFIRAVNISLDDFDKCFPENYMPLMNDIFMNKDSSFNQVFNYLKSVKDAFTLDTAKEILLSIK